MSKVFICASISSLIIVRCSSVRPLAPGGRVPVRSLFFLLIKARLCSTAASDMITAGTARHSLRYLRGARPPFLTPWAALGEVPSARNPLFSGLVGLWAPLEKHRGEDRVKRAAGVLPMAVGFVTSLWNSGGKSLGFRIKRC